MANCISGTCGCPAPKCPCTCAKTFGPVDLRRVWRVGTSADYAPFEDRDPNGAIIGFDIDLIKIIAQKLRFAVDLHDMDFDSLFPALGVRYIDVIAAAVSETPERSKFASFTDHYFSSAMVLLYRHQNPIDKDLPNPFDQLNDKVVAAQSGTTQEELLWIIKEGDGEDGSPFKEPLAPDMIIYTHTHLPTIVNLMATQTPVEVSVGDIKEEHPIFASIMIDKVADGYVQRSQKEPPSQVLEHTDEFFLFENIETCSFALPLGSSLVEVINGIIAELKEPGGEIDHLIEKWFGGSTSG